MLSKDMLCAHLVPLLVMHVVPLFCAESRNFDRIPEI